MDAVNIPNSVSTMMCTIIACVYYAKKLQIHSYILVRMRISLKWSFTYVFLLKFFGQGD